jgi:glycosyltransferase involved in cell wall biosynthesis
MNTICDILFLAKNRLEFTRASLGSLIENTNWKLVRHLVIIDDGSTDGTREYLQRISYPVSVRFLFTHANMRFNGPAAVMKAFTREPEVPELFAKIDNDVIVPPRWLDICLSVMNHHPELDLLGIEPWMSRTPHYEGGPVTPPPELTGVHVRSNSNTHGYAVCNSIGGIGVMRSSAFHKYSNLTQHSIYGGFTEWQLNHPEIRKGWVAPPLNVFLLDRLPIEPWRSLSREYITKTWQRAWSCYSLDNPFWSWWETV